MRYLQRDHERSHIALAWLSAAIVAAGAALRAWQYFGRSALWTDEATLANNIVDRSLGRLLFTPLDHNQAAPVGFLFVEKLATSIFGNGELALRAFPFACAIASLLLLWRVARRVSSEAVVPLVLAAFAFAPPLIYFASEVKQYSSDVTIALALLLVALGLLSRPLTTTRATTAAAVGLVAAWFSQPAVLVEAGLGAVLLAAAFERGERGARAPLLAVVGAWLLGALAAVLVSVDHLAPTEWRFMRLFWNGGFWPLSPRDLASWIWPFERIAGTLELLLALPSAAAIVAAALAIVGAWAAWRRHPRTASLLIAPTLVTLVASAARLYPFSERLVLFLIPSLALLAAEGVTAVVTAMRSAQLSRFTIGVATALVLALEARALHAAPPVYRREEITPAIEHLRRDARPTDRGYVYYGAAPAFRYYARDGMISASFLIGGCHRDDLRAYLHELDALRGGARVWVLFAHELPRLRERALMLEYLGAIGSVRDSVVAQGRDAEGRSSGVYLYLFDLSDSSRLSGADASTFAIAPQERISERLRCQGEAF